MRIEEGRTGEPVLRLSGLKKRYGVREALGGVELEIAAGEVVAVVGRNGAGKTTLLSIVAGVLPADDGTVSRPAGEIGWVPQQPALYSKLTVAENLRLFARLEKVADVEAAVSEMLAQSGLSERAGERLGRLSIGNRQRVNVAVGLLGGAPVVALDEPTTALDPAQRLKMWELVDEVAEQGTAVLFSTHIVGEAQHADRVLVLEEGRPLFLGPPSQLPGRPGEDLESALVAFLAAGTGGEGIRQ